MKTKILIYFTTLSLLIAGVGTTLFAQDDDIYSFEVDEFTKKTWEWKGSGSVALTNKLLNQNSVIYPLKISDGRSDSQDVEISIQLESRWDWDWSRLFLNGEVEVQRSTVPDAENETSVLKEAYWQLAEYEPSNYEIGKRLLRWGKGYAFNPVAFMEREKNPEDPEASREGLWVTQAVWILGKFGGFENTSINLVYLPINNSINEDYQSGVEEDNILGVKLYALTGRTDLDLYAVNWDQSDISYWGADFATNLTVNFELHGEYGVTENSGNDSHQLLLGMRYLTENDVTWISEVFHNSSGMTQEESNALFKNIETGSNTQKKTSLSMIQQASNLNQNYGYLKVSVKEPFDWLYFTPSIAWISNLDDRSSNLIAQASYAPVDNLSIQFTGQHLLGDRYTQYGENLVQNRFELASSYSF
ncbi:MAG: hypothetical protein GY786_08050 [Proteobacteria bacterium]|nr:hypothetical protein [Pseudomonadota bacterium]